MSVCSAHREVVLGCKLCESTPAEVLGITEDEWTLLKFYAEVTGIAPCLRCGFEQFRNHNMCVKCSLIDWEAVES